MQAVKAIYKNGNIQLLTPLQGVDEAELFVIVLDKNDQTSGVAQSFRVRESNSESDFQAIGLNSFFETDEDNKVDWEEMFDVKPR
jgi:hypothetical protein